MTLEPGESLALIVFSVSVCLGVWHVLHELERLNKEVAKLTRQTKRESKVTRR